tara:strand:- start:214 stop:408 length:195 start_codon:yes stop_codon:yes gene_type:complete
MQPSPGRHTAISEVSVKQWTLMEMAKTKSREADDGKVVRFYTMSFFLRRISFQTKVACFSFIGR